MNKGPVQIALPCNLQVSARGIVEVSAACAYFEPCSTLYRNGAPAGFGLAGGGNVIPEHIIVVGMPDRLLEAFLQIAAAVECPASSCVGEGAIGVCGLTILVDPRLPVKSAPLIHDAGVHQCRVRNSSHIDWV